MNFAAPPFFIARPGAIHAVKALNPWAFQNIDPSACPFPNV
jgi:hypothetical protein